MGRKRMGKGEEGGGGGLGVCLRGMSIEVFFVVGSFELEKFLTCDSTLR